MDAHRPQGYFETRMGTGPTFGSGCLFWGLPICRQRRKFGITYRLTHSIRMRVEAKESSMRATQGVRRRRRMRTQFLIGTMKRHKAVGASHIGLIMRCRGPVHPPGRGTCRTVQIHSLIITMVAANKTMSDDEWRSAKRRVTTSAVAACEAHTVERPALG